MVSESMQEKALKSQYRQLRELLTAAQYYAERTGETVSIAQRTQRLDGTFETRTVNITHNTQIPDVIQDILSTRLTTRNQVSPANLSVLTRVRIHEEKRPTPAIESLDDAATRFTRALRDVSDMMSTHTTIQSVTIGNDAFSLQQMDAIKDRILTVPAAAEPAPVAAVEEVAAPASTAIPAEPLAPEMALPSEGTPEEIVPHVLRKQIRLKAINGLYETMDGLMQDLQTITSDGLVSEEQFSQLLVITRGLRELTQQEVQDHKEGLLSEVGHIKTGLIGFSGVLRDAVNHMDDSPTSLPQKHVLLSMAQMLEFGRIPTEERLEKAWQEGQRHAMNMRAFHGNFLGALNEASQDPQALFRTIFDLAKLAGNKEVKHLSLNYAQDFGELKKLTHVLATRYSLRNDGDKGMNALLDHLGDLRSMLAEVSKPEFSADANPAFCEQLILQVGKTKRMYDTQLEAKQRQLSESFDNYVNFADSREQGLRKWLDLVIAEANAYHPIFSVTHMPSIYHTALLQVMESNGLATDTLTAPETKQLVGELDHYLRTGDAGEGRLSNSLHEYELTGGLKAGDLLANGANALQEHEPYRLLSGHEAYFPDGDLEYDPHGPVTNTAEILATGAHAMQPDAVLKGPDTFIGAGEDVVQSRGIIGFDHSLHDQMIEAGKRDGFAGKLHRGAAALSLDVTGTDLYAENPPPDTRADRKAEGKATKALLDEPTVFGYREF